MKKYKIALDVMGSDKGPEMIIRGVAMALAAYPKLAVLLVGKEELVRAECERCGIEIGERVEILDARDAITNYDSPAAAVFGKPESTLVKALTALSERDDLKGIINSVFMASFVAVTCVNPRADKSVAYIVACTESCLHVRAVIGVNVNCVVSPFPFSRVDELSDHSIAIGTA